jgi:hypothetical protein
LDRANPTRKTLDLAAVDAALDALGSVPGELPLLMREHIGDLRVSAERADDLLAGLTLVSGSYIITDLPPLPRLVAASVHPHEASPGEVIASEPQRAAFMEAGEVQSGALEQVEQFQTGETTGLVEQLSAASTETSEITRPVDIGSLPRHSEPPTLTAAELRSVTMPSGPRDGAQAHLLEEEGYAAEQVPWDDILIEDEPHGHDSDNQSDHVHSARRG